MESIPGGVPAILTKTRWPLIVAGIGLAVVAAGVASLRDPPWLIRVSTGFHGWERDESGRPFRWTNGHASFFVPSDAGRLVLSLRNPLPQPAGPPLTVAVFADDRWLTSAHLARPDTWTSVIVTLPSAPSTRRFRRIDLRVSRVVPDRNLGVMLGEVVAERGDRHDARPTTRQPQ
jgi:hypothetical protein